ncbi:MAG: hypothetical protein HON47_01210 [Candidatus Diapherotrites archaeon]|uniref:Uncharacterized protein n=1 Tax=Candidatus Iainarchaeum sp. TaxID=3101447 RepID=A0A8T5GDS4_9ARCH|nr:hypothetical protein [Candidatus Diapherotrites archaeon]
MFLNFRDTKNKIPNIISVIPTPTDVPTPHVSQLENIFDPKLVKKNIPAKIKIIDERINVFS